MSKRDTYQWEFTAVVKLAMKNARVDYIRSNEKFSNEISIAEVDDVRKEFIVEDRYFTVAEELQFEEELLAEAFSKLPLLRRQVLSYTFVHGLTAREIAEKLNCSEDSVYSLRHKAVKKLRDILTKEGDGYGKNTRFRRDFKEGADW